MINKKFKLQCPLCRSKDKQISKCRKCFYACCSNCSIDIVCIDCYITLRVDEELIIYAREKRLMNIIEVN